VTASEPSDLDSILNSKKFLLIDKLAMLKTALHERSRIQYNILRDIGNDSIWCQNELFEAQRVYDPKLEHEWKIRKLDLARETRQEYVSYFRDLTMLGKEVRDTMLDYIKEHQMEEMFQ